VRAEVFCNMQIVLYVNEGTVQGSKKKTQLVYDLLMVLLIERHVSAYSEGIIRFNKC